MKDFLKVTNLDFLYFGFPKLSNMFERISKFEEFDFILPHRVFMYKMVVGG